MTTTLTIVTILASIIVVVFILDRTVFKTEWIWPVCLLTLFATTAIGYGLIGASTHYYIIEQVGDVDITKNKRAIIIDTGNEFHEMTSHDAYENINDSTNFYYKVGYNHYDGKIRQTFHWTNEPVEYGKRIED